MSGYFRDQPATDEVLDHGWFRTGDLADCDDEGYYSIVGRSKEIIRTGGESVSPVEVDQVIMDAPGVAEGAVAGLPDEEWGEVIAAFVVLRPGATLSIEELRRHCADRLVSSKHPRRLYVVNGLPRTGATGQIRRAELVRQALASPSASDP